MKEGSCLIIPDSVDGVLVLIQIGILINELSSTTAHFPTTWMANGRSHDLRVATKKSGQERPVLLSAKIVVTSDWRYKDGFIIGRRSSPTYVSHGSDCIYDSATSVTIDERTLP
jgi:hypothetical protein